jgi:hypothetical protein
LGEEVVETIENTNIKVIQGLLKLNEKLSRETESLVSAAAIDTRSVRADDVEGIIGIFENKFDKILNLKNYRINSWMKIYGTLNF